MNFRKLTSELSVSPQIAASDLAAIKAAGFRAIICQRPDGEAADQPPYREIADAARAAGLEAHYQPVVPGRITEEDVARFAAIYGGLPKPVLAYCRSGTRSASVWALYEAAAKPRLEIVAGAKKPTAT